MSEPIRYSEVSNDWNGEAAGLAPSADGEWVKYEDYAAATQWRPIETAPKDGTVIWATNPTWKRPDYVKWGCVDHIDEWAWVHTHNRYNRTPEPVTHWMPIPKPPTA